MYTPMVSRPLLVSSPGIIVLFNHYTVITGIYIKYHFEKPKDTFA